jgi:signal transduction histidine kinase
MSKAVDKRIAELEKQHGISIDKDVQAGITVSADEHLLMEVVTILITNAIAYSTNEPQISVSLLQGKSGNVMLTVQDSGIGINQNELETIFERFRRGSNVAVGAPGHGLGLSLAREIARKSGGDISVKSEVGVGSVFTLTLS